MKFYAFPRLNREILACDFGEGLFLEDVSRQLKRRNIEIDRYELQGRLRVLRNDGMVRAVRVLKDGRVWINRYTLIKENLTKPLLDFISS